MINVVFLGEPGVGKTSIIKKFVTGNFQSQYKSTIGIDTYDKTLPNNTVINICDIAGNETFEPMLKEHFKKATHFVIVFDVNKGNTFESLDKHLDMINKILPRNDYPNLQYYLLANKTDSNNRAVSSKRAAATASAYEMKYFEVSASNGAGIENLFKMISENTLQTDLENNQRSILDEISSLKNLDELNQKFMPYYNNSKTLRRSDIKDWRKLWGEFRRIGIIILETKIKNAKSASEIALTMNEAKEKYHSLLFEHRDKGFFSSMYNYFRSTSTQKYMDNTEKQTKATFSK